ncbi:hypothetical protein GCM10023190_18220 [Enteractinococcus fodinae]
MVVKYSEVVSARCASVMLVVSRYILNSGVGEPEATKMRSNAAAETANGHHPW